MNKVAKIGILTLSDRASAGIYDDLSSKAIRECLDLWINSPFTYEYMLIPDDFELIKQNLNKMCDLNCDIIFTTGGTGPAKRDVTPEATLAICDKEMIGFGELMRSVSLKYTPTAILSRQTAAIKNSTLIINLPGNPKAIKECLEPIFPAIAYCLDLIGAAYITTNEKYIKSFRPKEKK